MARQTLSYGSFVKFHIYDDTKNSPFGCSAFSAGQLAVADANGFFNPSTVLFGTNEIGIAADPDLLGLANGVLTVNGAIAGPVGITVIRGGDITSRVQIFGYHSSINSAYIEVNGEQSGGAGTQTNGAINVVTNSEGSHSNAGRFNWSMYDGSDFRVRYRGLKNGSHTWYGATGVQTFSVDNSGNMVVAGDLRVDGGDIGLTADADLIGLAANVVTVRGTLNATTGLQINGTPIVQGITPGYGSMYHSLKANSPAASGTWYTITDFTGSQTDGTVVTLSDSVFTINTAGKYRVTMGGRLIGTADNVIYIGLSKNDAAPTVATLFADIRLFDSVGYVGVSNIIDLAATDTLRVKYQNTAATDSVIITNFYVTVQRVA